jgi:hypothetical protein
MDIVFRLSNVFHPGSDPAEDAYVLRSLLDCLIATDMAYLRYHAAPPLYKAGVVYGRTKEWLRIPDCIANRKADCKSLSAWRIAELRNAGAKANPTFRFRKRDNGTGIKDFHILVQTSTGYEDPSRVLGMGKNEWAHFGGGQENGNGGRRSIFDLFRS